MWLYRCCWFTIGNIGKLPEKWFFLQQFHEWSIKQIRILWIGSITQILSWTMIYLQSLIKKYACVRLNLLYALYFTFRIEAEQLQCLEKECLEGSIGASRQLISFSIWTEGWLPKKKIDGLLKLPGKPLIKVSLKFWFKNNDLCFCMPIFIYNFWLTLIVLKILHFWSSYAQQNYK